LQEIILLRYYVVSSVKNKIVKIGHYLATESWSFSKTATTHRTRFLT